MLELLVQDQLLLASKDIEAVGKCPFNVTDS